MRRRERPITAGGTRGNGALWLQVIVMTFIAAALIVTAGPLSQSLSGLYVDMTVPAAGSGAPPSEGSAVASSSEGSVSDATAETPRAWVAASRMVAFSAALALVEAERAAAVPAP